jgi:hypothetical protein
VLLDCCPSLKMTMMPSLSIPRKTVGLLVMLAG